MITITSPSNPTIKKIKSLYKKKERWNKRLFIIEGIKIVEELIKNKYPVNYIVYSDKLYNLNGGKELLELVKTFDNAINVPDKLFDSLSDTETPQGILAVVPIITTSLDDLLSKDKPFLLILDRVQDPGNLGTIVRTADAFGVDGIIALEGCVDVYNPKVVRATMGSIFRVPICNYSDGRDLINKLKNKGARIYTSSLSAKDLIQNVSFKDFSVLIIGNESKGVSKTLEDLSDSLVKIPMVGGSESLNAAIASSIIMYEVLRQRLQ